MITNFKYINVLTYINIVFKSRKPQKRNYPSYNFLIELIKCGKYF